MLRLTILFIITFITQFSVGQGYLFVGARSNSLANASAALVDAWAFHHNPGAVGLIKKTEIGISYENRFLLKDFQSQGLVYAQPIKKGVVSVGAQLYGLDAYRTTRIGAGYSLKLMDKLAAGVQLNYQGIRFSSNYGFKNTVTAEAGLLLSLTENFKFGLSVFNLGRTKLASFQNERLTTLMRLGAVYQFSTVVLLAIEVEKNVYNPVRLKSGIEYKPLKNLFLRGGFATQPVEFTFGFGYKFKIIQFDFGTAYHQLIGWSPHISLTHSFQ